MAMKPRGEWFDLDEHHAAQFIEGDGQIIGLSLLHHVKDMGDVLCEVGLVQWEPYGAIRPIFTVRSSSGQPLTLSPHIVCETCGDEGWIKKGEWEPRQRDEEFDLNVADAAIQMEGGDRCDNCTDCHSPDPVWCKHWGNRPDDAVLHAAQRRLRAKEFAIASKALINDVLFADKAQHADGPIVFEELTGDEDTIGIPTNVRKVGGHAMFSEEMLDYRGMVADEPAKGDRYSHRQELLDAVAGLVLRDRNNSYGPPHQDFQRSANALTALFEHKLKDGSQFDAHDIAIIVMVIKLSRLQWSPEHKDNWFDIAGYAACGFEAYEMTLGLEEDDEDG